MDRGDVEKEVLKELYQPRAPSAKVREIKVMVPGSYHARLHGYKVLTGKTISSMVNDALELYFRREKERRENG